MPDRAPPPSPTSQLHSYIKIAAQSIQDAANTMQKIKELLRKSPAGVLPPGTTTQQIAIEILTDNAIPLPVGSEGTVPILNDSDQYVTMKVGTDIPWGLPGTVQVSMPPGSTAAIQRTRSDAPPLKTQVVVWTHYDPCIPPIVGTICIQPDEWSRTDQVKIAGSDAVGVLIKTGWDSGRTISGGLAGLSLT